MAFRKCQFYFKKKYKKIEITCIVIVSIRLISYVCTLQNKRQILGILIRQILNSLIFSKLKWYSLKAKNESFKLIPFLSCSHSQQYFRLQTGLRNTQFNHLKQVQLSVRMRKKSRKKPSCRSSPWRSGSVSFSWRKINKNAIGWNKI